MTERIELVVPDNFHTHLRNGPMARWMVRMMIESGFRSRVLWMPNTKPEPVLTGPDSWRYREEIDGLLGEYPADQRFEQVSTIQITKMTTPQHIEAARLSGVRAGKVYPKDVTTNSELGVVDYPTEIYPALAAAEKCDMIVCFHAEHPSYDVEGLFKEQQFIAILEVVRSRFPRLRMVIEHVTTRAMIEWVRSQPKEFVRATITPQHCAFTIDDVIGYSQRSRCQMQVHNGCKPQPKFRDDLAAIQEAVTSGDSHFFYGGDDAPHPKKSKHEGACGCFNTTVALPFLLKLFRERDALLFRTGFFSRYGAEYYGYPPEYDKIVFERNPWIVPEEYEVPGLGDTVVPLFRGEEMEYRLVS